MTRATKIGKDGKPVWRSKYNNKRVKEDNITFDSLLELRRYRELKLLLKAGRIADFEVHRSFPIEVKGHLICHYEADFTYWRGTDIPSYEFVAEDCKGVKTPLYKLKKKLMKAVWGIDIVEIK